MANFIRTPKLDYQLVVVGAGPAGLAAVIQAAASGLDRILLIERDVSLGGILNQCIHNGFGLHHFKEELTGPEYAGKFIAQLENYNIDILLDTMVLSITPKRQLSVVNPNGYFKIQATAIVLAMGCRERARGAIALPGTRPAGVFTAGTAQYYLNIAGHQIGKRVLILGSGDIGLIMARRMTWAGAKVLACVEVMPHPGGLERNIAQCLNDFSIPLYLQHTIIDIQGEKRVEGAVIAQVDAQGQAVAGTEKYFACDTILLSVGLIPENELSRGAGIVIDPRTKGAIVYENMETSIPGIFACGNVVHVHDLVDFVTEESQRAGSAAVEFVQNFVEDDECFNDETEIIKINSGPEFGYTVPQNLRRKNLVANQKIFFRVRKQYEQGAIVKLNTAGMEIASYKKAKLVPGEMASITITKHQLELIKDEITLTVMTNN